MFFAALNAVNKYDASISATSILFSFCSQSIASGSSPVRDGSGGRPFTTASPMPAHRLEHLTDSNELRGGERDNCFDWPSNL
jgi:hypothetical protein